MAAAKKKTATKSTPRRGRLFVIAAPSGAGKTSLLRALMEQMPELKFSISCTTRAKRPKEVEGRDYFFVTPEQFARMRDNGEFLEHAQVFDNFYATPRAPVEKALAAGQDLIVEIDWQGAQQVRKALPEAITIFVLPPTHAALEERLRKRQADSDEVIKRRLRDAEADMGHWREFDYVIVNDTFEHAVQALRDVFTGKGKPYRSDRPGLEAIVASLLA